MIEKYDSEKPRRLWLRPTAPIEWADRQAVSRNTGRCWAEYPIRHQQTHCSHIRQHGEFSPFSNRTELDRKIHANGGWCERVVF